MRKYWLLPSENTFRFTGRDWLQLLLDPLENTTRSRVLLLLWRAWHLRNDVIHHKGDATIASSAIFLQTYLGETINPSFEYSDHKGKQTCYTVSLCRDLNTTATPSIQPQWIAPPVGWTKLNVDGSFSDREGARGAGLVLRNSDGKVLLAACAHLPNCDEAEEAEAHAALLGLRYLGKG
jgi:hypothetical protein